MLLQKNSDEGPVLQAIMKLAQAKKENQEVKKEPKKEDKKLPDDWDEDLERANREQEALNKDEFASVKVEVRVAVSNEVQFDAADENRLVNNFQIGREHGPWNSNFPTKGHSEPKNKLEDALEFAKRNNIKVTKENNYYVVEKNGITQIVNGPKGIIDAVMSISEKIKDQISKKASNEDCPCKDHGGCKCGGNKVKKTFNIESQLNAPVKTPESLPTPTPAPIAPEKNNEDEIHKLYTELGHIVMDNNNFKNGIFQWVGRAAKIKKRISELQQPQV